METHNSALLPGNPVTDLYYYNTPDSLHTWRAFTLFEAAEQAGFFRWIITNQAAVDFDDDTPDFALRPAPGGPIKTQTHLAYWCMCASTYLGLDRGPTETTYWKPFEDLLGKPPKTLSRATGPLDLDRDSAGRVIRDSKGWPMARDQYSKETIAFFNSLESDLNAQSR